MANHENFLSRATSRMEDNIGGWTAVTSASLSLSVRHSIFPISLDSEIPSNSLRITATGNGAIEVATEQFSVTPGEYHKAFQWVKGETTSAVHCGLRYYNVLGGLLNDTSLEFAPMQTIGWNGIFHAALAPETADVAEMYTTFDAMSNGDEMFITYPSVMQQTKITTDFSDYALYHLPDYMLEADMAQNGSDGSLPTPLIRYFSVGVKGLSDAMDTVTAWDFVHLTNSIDGETDYSSLTSPSKADAEWLPWLAQLMGVDLLSESSSGGRSPWLAFVEANIDTWTKWEESVDPGSVPGVPDTEWVDIESFNPNFFDVTAGYRIQIATGYDGILGGTAGSIAEYVASVLNTDETNPFVYVVKHHATNPYRILIAVLDTEDPDPSGTFIKDIISVSAPAGTSVETGHGVSITARNHYRASNMFYNMGSNVDRGGGTLPVRFVEGGAANGRHISLASVTGAVEPYLGGGVALARWYKGFAFYSGAMEVVTGEAPDCDITGDLDVRVLMSDVTVPDQTITIATSPNKWSLSLNTEGKLVFSWENGGTNTVTSTAAINWGNADTRPFWIRATLDVDNDASGHDVSFYKSPTLYEETWEQVGATVTTAGTSAIDSATATITMFGDETNPEDSVSGVIYRLMVHDGIDGTIAIDVNVTGEIDRDNSLVSTGTQYFVLPGTPGVAVNINPTATGATYLVESEWTAQVHLGGATYFYLGRSPYKFDSGNPTSQGDTLAVSGLPSDTYDWEITLLDQTTITGSTGTVTSITWDSDDYGGSSIYDITVREDTGQTIQAQFDPATLDGATTVADDTYGSTWTLTRAWTITDIYEYSSFVNRDHFSPTRDIGKFDSGMTFDADETFTAAVSARRFWAGSGVTNVVNHSTTSGWQIRYNGDNIEAKISSGPSTITLYYDEVAGGTLGEFSLITLRRDIVSKTISLWINDTEEDSIDDPFTGEGLFTTTGQTGWLGEDAASLKFDVQYFGMFDRSLDGTLIGYLSEEMARNVLLLPQETRAVEVPLMASSNIVYGPTVTQA